MKIIIDDSAGFCPGVQRTIQLAENLLQSHPEVYSLGWLIHNESEISRLQEKGLKLVDHRSVKNIKNPATVLVRAHGEPPLTFEQLKKQGVEIVDGTCPIVRRSQKKIEAYSQRGYQIVFVGKKNHPETIAMSGYSQQPIIVVEHISDLKDINPSQKSVVLAQTTIDADFFKSVLQELRQRGISFITENTICRYILNRDKKIKQLTRQSEVIIVVGGKNSSNTAVLYQKCKGINPDCYWIQGPDEIKKEWIEEAPQVRIIGGTSTPIWILQKVKDHIQKLINT